MNKTCLCCGSEITKDQHCAETPDQFAKRYNSGYCRSKCKRLHSPAKKERQRPTLDATAAFVYSRPEMVAQEKEKPIVDAKYRSWVRELPCLVPHCQHDSEFHHQNKKSHGGKGSLASDYRGLPLCRFHHTMGGTHESPGSYHGSARVTGWSFWKLYGVDVESTIHRLNCLWLEMGNCFKS